MGSPKKVSREQALEIILASIVPLETIMLPLEKAQDHVAGEDIRAPHDIPRFDRAVMDGYAICSKDTANATDEDPVKLRVAGEIHPSATKLPALRRGEAMRIMTGGPIPPGADAVVKEEDSPCSLNTIEVATVVSPFQYVSKKGKDIKKNTLIVEQGRPIAPLVLGTLASLQIRKVPVVRKPRVSILAVGTELIDLGDTPTAYSIVASNIYMLSAMIKRYGGMVGPVKISMDDEGAIRRDMMEALKSDMVITTGGSSNAHSDLTRIFIEKMGIDLKFSGVSMLPGKGTSFGMDHSKPVFCLPGTPSAVFAAFYTLVLPTLSQLMGFRPDGMSSIRAILEENVEKKPGIEHIVEGLLRKDGSSYRVFPLVGPDVEVFSAMAMANSLIFVHPDKGRLRKGDTVLVQPLHPFQISLSRTPALQQEGRQGQESVKVPVVSIVGKSDAGKTTLLERLVPELKARGYLVGTIKHDVHGFDIDHEGKDSWRHKQAGARTVVISSPKKVSVIKDVDAEETIDGLASKYFEDVDIILTEGYKRENRPKIEIFRSQVHDKPLCTNDDHLVALVSDIPLDLGVPRFELDDMRGLSDLVEQTFLAKTSRARN
jgi:molybdopterin-guanine dinucleotide biosynthesis protein MobB